MRVTGAGCRCVPPRDRTTPSKGLLPLPRMSTRTQRPRRRPFVAIGPEVGDGGIAVGYVEAAQLGGVEIVEDLVEKTLAAAREYDVQTLLVSGGVAANQELRSTFEREAGMQGLPVFFPSRSLSTDNAAMIAAAAYPKFLAREFVAMDFSAEAGLALR